MTDSADQPSARQQELLEAAYEWVLQHGLRDMSLRPLAEDIGTSPRVLLYLYGSKDGLVRALLARARSSELALLGAVPDGARPDGVAAVVRFTWSWLADSRHRPMLRLWVEAYSRSLVEPDGPSAHFAADTVHDWLRVLARAQPAAVRRTKRGLRERTLALGVLRGALLDLLATGDVARTTGAVEAYAAAVSPER